MGDEEDRRGKILTLDQACLECVQQFGHGVQHGTAALGLTVAGGMLFALAAWSRSPAR